MSVELEAVRDFLAQQEPFTHLPEEELSSLPSQMTMRYLRRGETIVEVGQVNPALYIIRSGAVDILDSDGILLDRRGPGLSFGYSTMEAFSPAVSGRATPSQPETAVRPETAAQSGGAAQQDGAAPTGGASQYRMVAVADTLLLELPRQAFNELAQRHPDIARFYSIQSRQVRAAAAQLADEASAGVLQTTIGEVKIADPVSCQPEATIREAAQIMAAKHVSSLLIKRDGALCGIVTDRDMRTRVVAQGADPQAAVETIMTSQPRTVTSQTLTMEAMMIMAESGIHHLPVVDGGLITGIVTQADIARLLHNNPMYLVTDLSRKQDISQLQGAFTEVTRLAARFGERGASAQEVSAMITLGADAIAQRLLALGEEKFGPAPVPYAFVVVGSQGRQEMGLASDQDNALVLDNSYDEAAHGEYFQKLTEFVCYGLADAGQILCPGDMMAMNPQWRMTQSQWEDTFAEWVGAPEPDALLHSQVFFDFRTIAGDRQLGDNVHSTAVQLAHGSRRLHAHLASLAARREPPLTFFNGLVVERSGEYAHTLNVKKGGTAGIVQMARLYSLARGDSTVDTVSRLARAGGDTVSAKGAADLADAFEFLRSVTLKHQITQLHDGQEPDYQISPKSLARLEREHLRDAFQIIKNMQTALATKYPVRNI